MAKTYERHNQAYKRFVDHREVCRGALPIEGPLPPHRLPGTRYRQHWAFQGSTFASVAKCNLLSCRVTNFRKPDPARDSRRCRKQGSDHRRQQIRVVVPKSSREDQRHSSRWFRQSSAYQRTCTNQTFLGRDVGSPDLMLLRWPSRG
jgi:hypothetical protein